MDCTCPFCVCTCARMCARDLCMRGALRVRPPGWRACAVPVGYACTARAAGWGGRGSPATLRARLLTCAA
eukprot:12456944-Alexandrium_andersonii.AAC.1